MRHWTFVCTLAVGVLAAQAAAADLAASGVPNFHKVDDHLYRGGQPTDAGWPSLSKLGVKTVIDLRVASEHSISREEQAVTKAGMHYVSEPLGRLSAPANTEILKILGLLNSDGPVFVHCRRGADRTGTVVACYRISHDHWSNQKALQEARTYGMSRLELGMRHFIQNFHLANLAAGGPNKNQ